MTKPDHLAHECSRQHYLVTRFRWAVPNDVPFYEGDIADSDLITKIIKEQNIGAVMHFVGSVVVPVSVEKPWNINADLDKIVSHALAWERKLGEIRAE